MIGTLYSWTDRYAGQLVLAALRRSITSSLTAHIALTDIEQNNCLLAINPDAVHGQSLLNWLQKGKRKLIIFGCLPDCLRDHFSIAKTDWPEPADIWAKSPVAETANYAESKASIKYLAPSSVFVANNWSRSLERFDFTDEWNNLGYGAVRVNGSIWSISEALRAPVASEFATIQVDNDVLATYCALFDLNDSSILWVNRSVGLIDSFEWRLVEQFISNWRAEDLPCLPVISEIPYGHDATITMRLDCDEDILSARKLWSAYREMNVPLSLAIHTNNLPNAEHEQFLGEFVAEGGALLSHTATHAPDWGGSYEAAYREASESRNKIETATGVCVNYAVSPFHQTPPYALAALSDAGYRGCIGGIIRNDPEFMLARGGELANLPQGFVGHSQQCMLHGDCMLSGEDPLAIFKKAFDQAMDTHTLFGYLDHPFSERYQYGWQDEDSRIAAHIGLISYIRSRSVNPLFISENTALDFLHDRAKINFNNNAGRFTANVPNGMTGLCYGVEFKGTYQALTDGAVLE